jgi:hypothetical protein
MHGKPPFGLRPTVGKIKKNQRKAADTWGAQDQQELPWYDLWEAYDSLANSSWCGLAATTT